MKKKGVLIALFFLFAFLIVKPIKSDAAFKTVKGTTYYYNTKGRKVKGWMTYRSKRYYFDQRGALKTGWQLIDNNWYYFSKSRYRRGVMLKGWQRIGKRRFYFNTKNGALNNGWLKSGKKTYYCNRYRGLLTGRHEINGEFYIFNSKGVMRRGWVTYNGKRCYLSKKTGAAVKGLVVLSRKLYYFDSKGVMQKSRTVVANGNTYRINSKGVCSLVYTSNNNGPGTAEDFIFFTKYESGTLDISGYAQTGGGYGYSCGQYQFDCRYSLLPLVKYCYGRDNTAFAEFKRYASWSTKNQSKLRYNKNFYKAWKTIFDRNPYLFKSYQDAYAKREYYDPAESLLRAEGINISNRHNVVKATVFSYSIHSGAGTAAKAVKACGINNSTNDVDFIKKLYSYRIANNKAIYRTRFVNEMNDALSRLK